MYKEIKKNKLLFVARSWSNRGDNTDFKHFFKFFSGSINITNPSTIYWDNQLYRWIKKQANQSSYSSLSVALEMEVCKKALIYKPKIIHFWFADHDYHYSYIPAKFTGAKLVGNFFFSIDELKTRLLVKHHLKKLDLLIATGEEQKQYLSQFISQNKIAILPLGIDTDFYKPLNHPTERSKQIRLLHVGINRRDIKTLIKVFLYLQIKFPTIILEMVGGKSAKYLFKGIKNIKFHSFLSDKELLKVYQRSSLLILPLLEGHQSSQSLNEAMAVGLPIVTNNFPNLRNYIFKDYEFISPSENVEMMAEHCEKLLLDNDLWMETSRRLRHHSLQFNFTHIKEKLINIYKQYLNIKIL